MPDRQTLGGASEDASNDANKNAAILGVTELDGAIRRIRTNQRGGTQVAPDANRQYRCYQFTLSSDSNYAAGETLNIGYDLAVKYGLDPAEYTVLGTSCFIVTSHDIQFKMNAITEDEICMRIDQWGNIWEFDLGDFGIENLYFANRVDSGDAGDALVVVFVTG